MQSRNACPTSCLVDELDGHGRRDHRERHPSPQAAEPAQKRCEPRGDDLLGAHRMGSEDDRRAQEVEPDPGMGGGLLGESPLDLGLLLGVEQVGGRPRGPAFGHPDRVVAVEPVGGDRRGVHESPGARRGRRPERVEGALDIDLPDRLSRRRSRDHEREVDDDVGALEGLLQRCAIADVALSVGQLRPAMRVRVERPAGDPDDPGDPRVLLQQRHQAEAERPGRTGDRNGEAASRAPPSLHPSRRRRRCRAPRSCRSAAGRPRR